MAIPEVSENEQHQPETDPLVQLVVRSVYGEMLGRPVNEIHRALNARLHAAHVTLASEDIREYAESISDGTFQRLR